MVCPLPTLPKHPDNPKNHPLPPTLTAQSRTPRPYGVQGDAPPGTKVRFFLTATGDGLSKKAGGTPKKRKETRGKRGNIRKKRK